MRLLVVEDDQILGDGITKWLSESGYATDWLQDGKHALVALSTESFDCVILDINLPDVSGLDILESIRKSKNNTPVLLLTARDTISDRVKGLDAGADDYMIKPFDLDELSARIRVLLRRNTGRTDPVITFKDIRIDPASHTVEKSGVIIELPVREYALLQLLVENAGKILSRSRIEENLYSWREDVSSNAVEVHIHHLRKKFGNDLIRTVRSVGYIIDKE